MDQIEIKVESGIPVPQASRYGKNNRRYPFYAMVVGESFMVPDGTPNKNGDTPSGRDLQRQIQPSAYTAGLRLKKKFVTSIVAGWVRVWRTE